MNKMFFCRFDRKPRLEVSKIISKFCLDTPEFISSPGCLITILNTEYNLEDLDSMMKTIEPPVAYFLIKIDSNNIEINFPQEIAEKIGKYLGIKKYKNVEIELNKDELENLLQFYVENEEYEKASKIHNKILNLK